MSQPFLQHCPVCHGAYPKESGEVLDKKAGANLLHLTCGKCRQTVLVLVVKTSFGLSSVGMLTDLSFADGLRLQHRGEVSEEELLAFHQLLKTNQFNFKNNL